MNLVFAGPEELRKFAGEQARIWGASCARTTSRATDPAQSHGPLGVRTATTEAPLAEPSQLAGRLCFDRGRVGAAGQCGGTAGRQATPGSTASGWAASS